MAITARQILEQFDRMAGEEKDQVTAEISRRTGNNSRPPLSDEELIFNAETIFLKLEEKE